MDVLCKNGFQNKNWTTTMKKVSAIEERALPFKIK